MPNSCQFLALSSKFVKEDLKIKSGELPRSKQVDAAITPARQSSAKTGNTDNFELELSKGYLAAGMKARALNELCTYLETHHASSEVASFYTKLKTSEALVHTAH
jgi:hypothetical protein